VIKVLIADDHPFVRRSLTDLLAAEADICVVAECADGSEVAAAAARTRPDVVLMDLLMPRMSGLAAAKALRAAQPGVRVIVLTGSLKPSAAREARELGLAGFLLKGDDVHSLADSIRAVAAGGSVWNPATEAGGLS
jgi:DNA-binding NarL/FixJ family response regulator